MDSTLDECCSVIFHDVKEYYNPDSAINCQFSVKENSAINDPTNCFVGILLVAWDSLESAVAKKGFSSVELEARSGIYDITFDSTETPNSNFEDEEFYQFCFYNMKTKDVFGASCPFQICHSKEESMIHIEAVNSASSVLCQQNVISSSAAGGLGNEFNWWLKGDSKPVDEDLDDTVLIHNKTTMLENALAKAAKDKEDALLATKLKFESELKQFSSEKKEINEKNELEFFNLNEQNKSLLERESSLKQNLIDSQNVVKQMETFAIENSKKYDILLQTLTSEKEILMKASTDKEAANIEHINKIKSELNAKIEASEISCDNLNKLLITEKGNLEKMEYEYNEILVSLRNEIKLLHAKESESLELTSKGMTELQTKLNAEVNQKYECLGEIDKLTQSVERLTEENKVKDTHLLEERNKLASLSLQQQEMTSRFNSENEKILAEIQTLKSHEDNLVEAHHKELNCLKSRISEMDVKGKEEKSKMVKLNDELNDKINCINILEAKIISKSISQIEVYKQENVELNDTIDELKTKVNELEHEKSQLADESKKICNSKNSENGCMYALNVANTHMQKQLNGLKKEKEKLQQKLNEGDHDLRKENEEFRLRLCMGKKAFDKQYLECQKLRNEVSKSKQSTTYSVDNGSIQDGNNGEGYNTLLLQYNNMIADNSKIINELVAESQKAQEQNVATETELTKVTAEKDDALKLNEELRVKLLKLIDHYEGKISLLTEENGMLKTQRAALMQGAGTSSIVMENSSPDIVQTVASVATFDQPNLIQISRDVAPRTEIPKTLLKNKGVKRLSDHSVDAERNSKVVQKQPDVSAPPIINHPKSSSTSNKVVEKQPTLLEGIMYPPSLRNASTAFASPATPEVPRGIAPPQAGQRHIAIPVIPKTPLINAEPPSQVIRMLTAEQPIVSGRGKPSAVGTTFHDSPTQQCPICSLDFPSNISDSCKTEHVNRHFIER